jgi:hypothetical protein
MTALRKRDFRIWSTFEVQETLRIAVMSSAVRAVDQPWTRRSGDPHPRLVEARASNGPAYAGPFMIISVLRPRRRSPAPLRFGRDAAS